MVVFCPSSQNLWGTEAIEVAPTINKFNLVEGLCDDFPHALCEWTPLAIEAAFWAAQSFPEDYILLPWEAFGLHKEEIIDFESLSTTMQVLVNYIPRPWGHIARGQQVINNFLIKLQGMLRVPFCGFSCNLGNCTISEAGLYGIWYGLKLALDKGIQNILIESDSRNAFLFLAEACAWYLLAHFNFHQVSWSHIFREANSCADALEKHGHTLDWGVHILDRVSIFFLYFPLFSDSSSTLFERVS